MRSEKKPNNVHLGDRGCLNASWPAQAGTSSDRNRVLGEFSPWVASIKNINLAAKARELWRYLNDKNVSLADKAIIVAALLYCVAPIDLVPDHIPLAGLLDDLAVVLRVLTYVVLDATASGKDGFK